MKKFIKRIGKGIKRLGKKIGKFVGRIGKKVSELPVLGQIALAIAMPYAAGAIWKGVSSLAGMAGTQFSWATLGTAGKALTGSQNIISKVLGRTMQAISWTAQAPGKAYNFITDMIGTGIDRLKNSEFIQGTKDWMQKTFGVPQLDTADDLLKAGQYIPFEDLTEQGLEIISKATPEQMKEISRMGLEEWVSAGDPSTWPAGSLFKPSEVTEVITEAVVPEVAPSLYEQATTPETGEAASPEDIAISEGAKRALKVANQFAQNNEQPVDGGQGSFVDPIVEEHTASIYNSVDYTRQAGASYYTGFPYGGYGNGQTVRGQLIDAGANWLDNFINDSVYPPLYSQVA